MAMGAGLITGMACLSCGVLLPLILGAAMMACSAVRLHGGLSGSTERTLSATIPKDLDYAGG